MSSNDTAKNTNPSPNTQPSAETHHAFGRAYWMLNGIEMFERLAYFGIRAVVPLYIMQATEPGGLHLTAMHKGWIYMWWAIFQSFLPIITGGIADRYGYKRVLFFAISANAIGYIMMANLHNYYGFFAGILVLATGTAFFKPALQGSIAQNLTKDNSSLGWGIFYWVVNIGAFAAPFISTIILGKPHSLEGWQNLFYACAIFTAFNLLLLLTFKDVPSGADKTESPFQVLWRTIVNIFEARLITWLLIMSCFWLMMYQLWDLHPNFITDWVDSSMIAKHVPTDQWWEYGDRGNIQVPQQILMNLNAGLIILLIVPLSWASRKMRTLSAMLVGMSVATVGVFVAGWTTSGLFLLLGIAFFSLGEMWTGPKKNEYLGLIAPPGKKGLYLGYVNIPVGIGVGIGSYFGGWLYDNYGEKASLALKELADRPALVARASQGINWSDSLHLIPDLAQIDRDNALSLVAADLNTDLPTAREQLRDAFQYDQGQITNLGYLYLAQHAEFRNEVNQKLVTNIRDLAKRLRNQQKAVAQAETTPTTKPTDLPVDLEKLADQIHKNETQPDISLLARYLKNLPDWTDEPPVGVFPLVRELINTNRENKLSDSQIINHLWDHYGNDPGVISLLALEYLAQETYLVRDRVMQIAERGFDKPVEQIPTELGIDRTEAFQALSVALGADANEVVTALEKLDAPDTTQRQKLFLYLVNQPHLRYIAVAKRIWSHDVDFLEEMIASDPAAKKLVEQQIDSVPWTTAMLNAIYSLFSDPGQQTIYQRLADRPDLIQKALAAKNWSQNPTHAQRLLLLNPYEARAQVAIEVNHSAQASTQLLWDKYDPNAGVWLPIVAIGIIATIALGVFGQMAKRWKDMNA